MKKIVFLPLVLVLAGCSGVPAGTFDATERAAASLALDFSECVKADYLQLATAGMLSKDAAFASAEKCGVANIKDGLALIVAAFNDVKNYIIAKHAGVPVVLVAPEPNHVGTIVEVDAGAMTNPAQ